MNIRRTSFGLAFLVMILTAMSNEYAVAQSGACTIDHDHEAEDRVEPFFLRPATSARLEGAAELPLKGTRSFKLNTTEGTWLALDVSPDGKKIVFAMLGDIYEMPVTGGKAKQLTSGIAFDCQPKYSPDGKSIAFISDRDGAENVYLMNAETAVVGKQLTKSRDEYFQGLEWSPDGQYIVVAKGVGTPKLNLYHIAGGTGTLLTPSPDDLKTIEPAFSKDGGKIWFARRKGMWDYNAQLPQYQLATFDRKTGEMDNIVSRYGSAFSPTLSPDGKWLVYGTRYNTETGLVLHNLKTAEEKWLAYPVQHDEQESLAPMGVLPAMSFTPDSKNLIATYGGKIYSIAIDGSGAKELPFQVETEIMIGPKLAFKYPIKDDPQISANQIRDLAISPDGKKAVFTAFNRLYIMDYPNGTPKRMTSMELTEAQPAWSPDGKSIAYVTWDDQNGAIYKIAASAGSKPQLLTEKGYFFQEPEWSPDGTRIVFVQGLAVGYRLGTNNRAAAKQSVSWIAATGGKTTFISKAVGARPHFSNKDGNIYLSNVADGLFSIDWNGLNKKGAVKLTGITTYDFSNTNGAQFSFFRRTATPSRIIKAPVGDKALALIANEIYIVTVPEAGAVTPVISVADVTRAQYPSWKITEIGAEFPSWSEDGKKVYWSLGSSMFAYDLDQKETSGYTAQETKVTINTERDIPQAELLLQGARIITMKGDEVIENGRYPHQKQSHHRSRCFGITCCLRKSESDRCERENDHPGFL